MDQVYVWRERLLPYCVEIQGLPSNTITQGLKEYFKSASEFEILQEESCWKVLVLFPQRQDADDLVAIGKLEIVLDDEDPESCTLDIYGCREACDIPLTWEKYSTEETIGTNHSTEQTDVRPTFPGRPTTDCQQWRAPSHSTNRMQYSSEKRTRPPPAYQGDPRNQFQPYHGRSDSFPVQANMPGGQWQPYGLPGSNVGPHGPPYHIPPGWSQYPLGPGPPIFGGPGPAIPFGPGQAVPLGPDSPFRTPYQMPPGYPPHTGQGPMVASASPGYQEPLQQYAQQQLLTDHSSSTQKTDSGNIKTKTVGREHVNDEVDVYANTIIVSKLPEQLRERDLKKFFESKKKSSGGPVEKVDINHENQTATVTFKEKEVVSRVLARRPILFKNAILEIEEFRVESESDDQSSEEESTDSDVEIQIDLGTIEVSGMSLGTSEDTVMFYFENKRKSGGGNIKTFEFDADNGKANITFEDTSVVDGIIRRKHALNGKTLEVKRFVPPPPVQVCEDKVLLRDVNPDTSKDALENFLELKASALPKSLIFGEVEGTVLVTFGKRIDFDTFQDGCQKRKLEGSYLKPERVPITNCVYVGGLNPITSNDALEMFFENTKRSGGGAIQKIEMSNDDHSCLIFFEDFTVVDTVCDSRQLVLDKSTLSVHPHYECLGETRDAKMPTFKAPMSVVIQDTDKIKMYAFLYQHGRRDVDQTLEAKHAQIDWPKHIDEVKFSVSSTLTATTKNVRKLAKTWNDDVLHAMSEIEESLKMKSKHFPLDKPGIQEILQSESGKLYRRDIEKRRTCIIEVSTNGIEDSTRSSHPGLIFASHPQPIATGTTKEGISIKTLQGDITQLKADVIVNAANSSMDHAGGLAKTIVTKGGQRIQDACTDYIKQKGHLQDGNIYCSQPGNLKCKMIAHANSPNWQAQLPRTPESTPGAEATFGQVTVTIRMGEITEAACEAIICSTDRHFNITEGQLERAIRQKTGGNLDKEIEKLKKQLTRNGHALMSVKNMKSDFILFVNAHGDFEKSLRHAMTKADDKGITSVAVPLISTGARTSTAEAFSLTISKVIAGISFRKVERIDVVLTQHADLADITSGVKNYIDSNSPGMIGYLKGKIGYGLPYMSFRYKPVEQPTMSSITLVIYGKVERSLDAAYRDVELFCANEMVEKTIDDPIIKEFTDQQISKFDEFKESLGVKVTLEKRLHRLRISGLPRSVQNATYEINHMIKTMLLDKENEKITAKCVEWSVIEVDTTDTKRIPYPEKINHTIEKDYQKQLQTTQFFADSNCYEIDFTTMEKYPVNDQTDRAKVLRKDKLQVQQGLELPTTWSPMTEQEPITVEPVLATDAAYTEVSKDFEATQSNSTIVKIERIQNKTLYQQYVTKKAEVDRSCSIQSERMLWHGIPDGAVDTINLYGFNRNLYGKYVTVYGNGVYFARTSNYSASTTCSPADQAGQKRMYRCRVLTGDFTQGQQGMRIPPAKQGHILYDSVVDNTTNPNMFIIFNDTQAYPEYLITFTV